MNVYALVADFWNWFIIVAELLKTELEVYKYVSIQNDLWIDTRQFYKRDASIQVSNASIHEGFCKGNASIHVSNASIHAVSENEEFFLKRLDP